MTKNELSIILNKIGKLYGKTFDAEMVASYNVVLGNQHRFRVLRAFLVEVQTAEFFPKPNSILHEIYKDTSAMPSPFDEACHWMMFARGISDPGELKEEDIYDINEKIGAS